MKHYSKAELEMYRDKELGTWQQMVCKAHLSKCRECQLLLHSLKKDDELLNELKDSIHILNKVIEMQEKKK